MYPTPRRIVLLLVFTILAAGVWACSGTEQVNTGATTQEQEMTSETTTESEGDLAVVATTPTTTTAANDGAETSDTPASTEIEADTQHVFTIDQSQSEARFTLDEELMGAPKTVVGVTSLVDGAINIDLADLSNTTISSIQIDARDFTTDSDRRNGAIRRFVLGSNSDENRYIVFAPTAITGFPETANVGDTFELQITGDLTISGITNPVTFATSITVDSAERVSGLATAQILRAEYNLTIPSVPSVANVSEEVLLELAFVAGS